MMHGCSIAEMARNGIGSHGACCCSSSFVEAAEVWSLSMVARVHAEYVQVDGSFLYSDRDELMFTGRLRLSNSCVLRIFTACPPLPPLPRVFASFLTASPRNGALPLQPLCSGVSSPDEAGALPRARASRLTGRASADPV
jgi:hypothetical protein